MNPQPDIPSSKASFSLFPYVKSFRQRSPNRFCAESFCLSVCAHDKSLYPLSPNPAFSCGVGLRPAGSSGVPPRFHQIRIQKSKIKNSIPPFFELVRIPLSPLHNRTQFLRNPEPSGMLFIGTVQTLCTSGESFVPFVCFCEAFQSDWNETERFRSKMERPLVPVFPSFTLLMLIRKKSFKAVGFGGSARKIFPDNRIEKGVTGYVWLGLVNFGYVWLNQTRVKRSKS
jgi:hypothetical protein